MEKIYSLMYTSFFLEIDFALIDMYWLLTNTLMIVIPTTEAYLQGSKSKYHYVTVGRFKLVTT